MPSLKDIRTRVGSVKNTQKITKAMKLVAAAKMRRATDAVVAARPYSATMRDTLAALVAGVDADSHPLFKVEEAPRKCLIVTITSDRGLCGGFNSNTIKKAEQFRRNQKDAYQEIGGAPIGKKGEGFYRRNQIPAYTSLREVAGPTVTRTAEGIAAELIRLFTETEVDEIFIVFSEFKSALTQSPVVQQLLPLSPSSFEGAEASASAEFIYEPDKVALLDALLPKYIESQIIRALLESSASEQAARMTAMDSATKNAKELIDKLTLQVNRLRQAAITKELMEITSGAESLKG